MRKGGCATKKSILKICITVLVTTVIVLLSWYAGTLVTPQALKDALEQLGPWAAGAYIGLFAVLPAFFFPVAVLALAGGLLFGLWQGAVYTFLGAIVNCSVMFWMARNWCRQKIEGLVRRRLSISWQRRMEKLEGREGFIFLILLRLIPAVPYNLINYAYGLTGMSYRSYILASSIGIIPGTFAFINIGDKALDIASPDFWIALGLLGLLLAVTALLGKKLFPNQTQGEQKHE